MIRHLPLKSFTIVIIVLLAFIIDDLTFLLIYERDAILDGELWRLFTSHFIHFSELHLGLNIMAFGIIGWIMEERSYPGYALLIFLMSFLIGVGMILFKPDMQYYGGLSGIAHGALVYLALFGLEESKPWNKVSYLVLASVLIKVGIELFTGNLLTYATETFIPIPLSHMIGIFVALSQFYILKIFGYRQVVAEK
ncbi:MAG: rhombosortase [Campylobacterota bacterium]|nr:rhombosortase [Campylobacterota bacterium]